MATKTRQHPHPVRCNGCRKLVPPGQPIHFQVGFFAPWPADPVEHARRSAYEDSLSEQKRASLKKLRAVFDAIGHRRGWTYGVFCQACKETEFEHGRDVDAALPAYRPETFEEHRSYEYHGQPCRGCGRPMYWHRRYQLPRAYCGEGCRTLYRRRVRQAEAAARRYEPTCAECGEVFQARRNDARYCSARCRQRAKRARSSP